MQVLELCLCHCNALDAACAIDCVVTCGCSYMTERMGFRSKELVVEKAALEAAMAKEEVRWCLGVTQGVFSHFLLQAARAAAEADAARKAAVRWSRSSTTRKTLNPLCCRRMRLRLLRRWWRWRRK